ncbi:MAG: TatD family hydrolase [Calditrichaeota bacterium]|nr:TatD family hydrolase [Calditrichota bacterium]
MFFIDTHCHIDFDSFDNDRDQVVQKAREKDVHYLINIGCERLSNQKVLENSKRFENVYFSSGIHPSDVDQSDLTVFDQIEEFASQEKMVAVGEIGLDYFKYDGDRERQKTYFKKAIQLAAKLEKPIVVHNREADQDVAEILRNELKTRAVLHCFASTAEFAREMVDLGIFISFTGIITFKNSTYDDVVKSVPIEQLMLETDSPFLTPHPFRGKRNDPSYIPLIAEKVASLKNMTIEDVQRKTTENAIRFFNLPFAIAH